MGRVVAPFGVKGWVKVQTFTASVDALLDHEQWWLGDEKKWSEAVLEDGAPHGQTVVAKLRGVDDRDAAGKLKGLLVALPREALPATQPGEYYWTDLIGLEVVNREGVCLGTVENLMDNSAQGVLIVKGERERLIPFVPLYVEAVDLDGKKISVDWSTED